MEKKNNKKKAAKAKYILVINMENAQAENPYSAIIIITTVRNISMPPPHILIFTTLDIIEKM